MAKTFYLRSTALATGVHAVGNGFEDELAEAAGASTSSLSIVLAGGAAGQFLFTTPASQPNSAAWPTGASGTPYRCIFNVTAIGADSKVGLTIDGGSGLGHFSRVNAALSSELETHTQAEAMFTGTGVKTATYSSTWTAGAADDRLEVMINTNRPASHGNQTTTIDVDNPSANPTNGGVVDGPWTVDGWADVGALGVANSTTSGTTLVMDANAVSVGQVCVLSVAADNLTGTDGNTSDHVSVTDVRENVWWKAREFTNGNVSAGLGATTSIWVMVCTTALVALDDVTITFASAVTAKACTGRIFSIGASKSPYVAGSGDRADDLIDAGAITISSLPSQEYLWIRSVAAETNGTTYSPSTNYTAFTSAGATADTGVASTSMGARGEFRVLTATTDTTDPTAGGGTVNHASTYVALGASMRPIRSVIVRQAVNRAATY